VLRSNLLEEILRAIEICPIKPGPRASESLKDDILDRLHKYGWSDQVELDPTSHISITSLKSKAGLCFQTGNMGRMYADLLKLQTLYLRGSINVGVMIVPTLLAARQLGSNIANLDRLALELPIFERAITVPIMAVGIE
jgi:hypothetical protein